MNGRKDIENLNRYGKLSRRDFIKYTGTIIFVVGSRCYLLAAQGPVQHGDEGYKVNLRIKNWQILGYPNA